MYKFAIAVASVATCALSRQIAEQDQAYTDMDNGLTGWGYTYEVIKVKNEAGYMCDMFHLTGKQDGTVFTPTKPAVVFTHGLGGDSREWISVFFTGDPDHDSKLRPQAMQLAEQGFDVYMGNNSGTYFCYEHETLTIDDKDFWMMDWVEFGTRDTVAQVKEIQTRNGGAKVGYVGHSQGTTQAFAALARMPEWFDANVNAMALYGPCTIMTEKYIGASYNKETWDWLNSVGIYVLGGPNWPADRALILESAPDGLKYSVPLFDGLKNFPTQAIAHYSQCGLTNRFQEYVPDWWDREQVTHSDLLDVGKVSEINLGLFVGLWDDTCPTYHAADLRKQMGEHVVTYYKVCPWQGHSIWGMAQREWFIDDLATLLEGNMERTTVSFLQ